MATNAELIRQYIQARPYAVIRASQMLDDLGLYSTNNNTGHRSYATGSPALREVVAGIPASGYSKGRPPFAGIEILQDAPTNQGLHPGGRVWHKIVFKYVPPAPTPLEKAAAQTVTAEAEADSPTFSPVSGDMSAVLAELVEVNRNFKALLALQEATWGNPTEQDLKRWAEDDEQVDGKEA